MAVSQVFTLARAGDAWERFVQEGLKWAIGTLLAAHLALAAQAPAPPPAPRTGPIIAGVNTDYPPYEFLDGKGQPTGYDVDLTLAVARVMGLDIRIRADQWNVIRHDLETGRIQILPGMLYSKERERLVDFSAPHLVVHYSIFVQKGTRGISTLEDLRNRRVAVERGSQMHDHLTSLGMGGNAVVVDSEPEALRFLAAGKCDAALVPHIEGILQAKGASLTNVQPVGAPVFDRELCFAVTKGDKDLQSRLNTGLAILNRTGEYQQIYRKWFGEFEGSGISARQVARAVAWILFPLGLLVAGVLVWNRILRRQVTQRTRDLKQALSEKQENERFLRTVVENLPVALFAKDPRDAYRFTIWNAKSEEIFGLSREQVLGKNDYDFFPKDQADFFLKVDEEVMEQGRLVDVPEEPIDSKSLGTILLHTVKVPIRDLEGRPRHLLGISEDITQRKRIESVLRQSQASLAEAQALAHLGNWEWDLEKDEIHWSEELYRILGCEPGAEPASFPFLIKRTHPEDREHVERAFNQALEDRGSSALDHRILLPDGTVRHLHSTLKVTTDPAGRILKILGTAQDITLRRITEENLRQAQKLEGLGVLAGGIAHDFNNLLAAIIGNINLAEGEIPSTSRALPYLKNAERAVSRSADLTRQMLVYAGKGLFVVEAVDLNRVALEMTSLLQVSISKKALLNYALKPGLPLIDADVAQIQQVIMNLVANASEAIGEKEGRIVIATGVEHLDAESLRSGFPGQDLRPGLFVTLEVSDNGCGMKPETRERIFEPFFTTKFAGRGLGLSALQGIVTGHHGAIHVTSEAGQGTAFRIYFPARKTAEVESQTTTEEVPRPSRLGTILLVEDEEDLRAATAATLRILGYGIIEAVDGFEAVETFRKHAERISAVLMDLTMPRMNGREALRAIREIDPQAKVILCSGFSPQEAEGELRSGSIAGFLKKPYGRKELQSMLQKILG